MLRGKLATVDAAFSIREAVAVRGGTIVYVGDRAGAGAFVGPGTKVVDAAAGLVLPGLVDAHAHMYSYAEELANLDVTGTGSFVEVVARVAERARSADPGEWIVGGRWDQIRWPDTSFPVHDALSAVSPSNRALGMEKDLGSIEAGKKADLILLDMFKPHLYPGTCPSTAWPTSPTATTWTPSSSTARS